MSLAIAHFAVGYAGGVLLMALFWGRVSYFGAVVSSIWGVFPDLHHLMPEGSWYQVYWYYGFHETRWADFCWFHYTMDQLDPNDTIEVALGAVVMAVAVTLIVEVWLARQTEKSLTSSPP